MTDTTTSVTVFTAGEASIVEDHLAAEEPIELRIGDTPIAVLMRTPGNEVPLALGFCLTEGILLSPDEFDGLDRLDTGRFRIRLADGVAVDPEQFRRNTYTTSSCGVCGKASIDAILIASRPLPDGPTLEPRAIVRAIDALREVQPAFDLTGGLHAAAVQQADGTMLGVAEDIGRHNAVDKAIGLASLGRWPIEESMLVVSGRTSFEITQKAAVAGIPIVAGVSAASSLAVDLARDVGMTLVGFVRDQRMVVYSGTHRISTS